MSSHVSRLVSTALLVVAVSPLALAQSALTLDEALRIAQLNAPSVAAASGAAAGARQMAVAVDQLPDPVFRAGIDNLPVNGPDAFSFTSDFMTMRKVGVMQEYVSVDKRRARRQREERDADRWEADAGQSRSDVRVDVATTWYERLYASKAEHLMQSLVDEVAIQRRAVEAQIASGRATPADVLATDALLAQTRDRASRFARQQQAATARLARWLGVEAKRPQADDAVLPGIDELGRLKWRDYEHTASVRLAQAAVELADAEVAIARQNREPNWIWEISYAQRGPAYSNMISVGVAIPLPIDRADRQDRELAARVAQRDKAQAELEEARRIHEAEFDSLRVELIGLRERQAFLETTLLPVSRQRIDVLLAGYSANREALAQVLEARRQLVEARVQVLDLERETAQLWARLQYKHLQRGEARVTNGGMP